MLPDGSGLGALKEMRDRGDTTPVLILTALGAIEDGVRGLDGGADDYLVKPFAMQERIARLRALLRRPGAALGRMLTLFFFQAEDGIRDGTVTGVQTCALPILIGAIRAGDAVMVKG